MSTLVKSKEARFGDRYLHVELEDGRVIRTPMNWYPELQAALFSQISNYQFICQNTGIQWPELDYHLSIEGMLVAPQRGCRLLRIFNPSLDGLDIIKKF